MSKDEVVEELLLGQFQALSVPRQKAILFWAGTVFVPAPRAKTGLKTERTPYHLKHFFAYDGGFYTREEEFAGALITIFKPMLNEWECLYKPGCPLLSYRIRSRIGASYTERGTYTLRAFGPWVMSAFADLVEAAR